MASWSSFLSYFSEFYSVHFSNFSIWDSLYMNVVVPVYNLVECNPDCITKTRLMYLAFSLLINRKNVDLYGVFDWFHIFPSNVYCRMSWGVADISDIMSTSYKNLKLQYCSSNWVFVPQKVDIPQINSIEMKYVKTIRRSFRCTTAILIGCLQIVF